MCVSRKYGRENENPHSHHLNRVRISREAHEGRAAYSAKTRIPAAGLPFFQEMDKMIE